MKITRLNTVQEFIKIELVITMTPGELAHLKDCIDNINCTSFCDVGPETEETITSFINNLNEHLFQ